MRMSKRICCILAGAGLVATAVMGDTTNTFVGWEFDNIGTNNWDSGYTQTDWNTLHPTNADPAWIVVSQGELTVAPDPIYVTFGQDALGVGTKGPKWGQGGDDLPCVLVLPFGSEPTGGQMSTFVKDVTGLSFSGWKVALANIDSSSNVTMLAYLQVNGKENNPGNHFVAGGGVTNYVAGIWKSDWNAVTFSWTESTVSADITTDATNVVVTGASLLQNLPVNAFAMIHNSNPNNFLRRLWLDTLDIELYIADEGYVPWIQSFGLTNSPDADLDYDFDNDGKNNLAEYALNGNPTNPAITGVAPEYTLTSDGGTNWLNYIHLEVLDDTVDYQVEQETDLTVGAWTNESEVVGSGSYNSEYDVVTNRVSTDTEDIQFLRLKISK